MDEAVATLERAALAAIACDEPVNARALQLLLRRYESGAFADPHAHEIIGQALAAALESHTTDQSVLGRAAWTELFVEATALSDDDRLIEAVGALIPELRGASTRASFPERCAAIGACLRAAGLEAFTSIAADMVDELERAVGRAYEPGEHIGSFADQVRAASSLLTGYGLTGRLPYSMLAEELMQMPLESESADLDTVCEGARVLCRLAALRDDVDYRSAAVVAPRAEYRAAASTLLDARVGEALRAGAAGAIYALARLELESQPHEKLEHEAQSAIRNPQSEI